LDPGRLEFILIIRSAVSLVALPTISIFSHRPLVTPRRDSFEPQRTLRKKLVLFSALPAESKQYFSSWRPLRLCGGIFFQDNTLYENTSGFT
jgi:hypothetical protein